MRYKFDLDKFLAVLGFLVKKCGPMTKLKIVKLLYLLDRRHFNLHGRPVLGDRYLRMDYGPMPTLAKDLIDTLEERATFKVRPVAEGRVLSRYFKVEQTGEKYPRVALARQPGTDALSQSEIEALEWTISKYGHLSASALVDITHRHVAWKQSEPMSEIDYRLFPKDDREAAKDIAEIAAFEHNERAELMEALSLDSPARSA